MIQNEAEMIATIKAVCGYMTCKDMEEEFGFDGQQIRHICEARGIKLLSPVDINIAYIKEMAEKRTAEQIAKTLKIGVARVLELARKAGVKVKTPGAVKKEKARKPYSQVLKEGAFHEFKQIQLAQKRNEKRIKEKYTQCGSPFGIADDMKGISIK